MILVTSRYYDDFHTIDWVRDRIRDRARHKKLIKNQSISTLGFLRKFSDAGSGWFLVFLVGVSSGLLAGNSRLIIINYCNVMCILNE